MENKKFKLINRQTKEETLCDKITIDGYDYYMSDDEIKVTTLCYNKDLNRIEYYSGLNDKDVQFKVIATNNPNIDIPKVVDEVEEMAYSKFPDDGVHNNRDWQAIGYIKGYNKAKETYQFSEDDMIDFGLILLNIGLKTEDKNHQIKFIKEFVEDFKMQQVKTIYYE